MSLGAKLWEQRNAPDNSRLKESFEQRREAIKKADYRQRLVAFFDLIKLDVEEAATLEQPLPSSFRIPDDFIDYGSKGALPLSRDYLPLKDFEEWLALNDLAYKVFQEQDGVGGGWYAIRIEPINPLGR